MASLHLMCIVAMSFILLDLDQHAPLQLLHLGAFRPRFLDGLVSIFCGRKQEVKQ